MIELRFDRNDPFNAHVRICKYCGDTFIANHALRQFCPSKFGRANYCKYQYKELRKEKELVEEVSETEEPIIENPKEKNIRILHEMMAYTKERVVSSDLLVATGFNLNIIEDHWITDEERFAGIIDRYSIEEEDTISGPFQIYKITKYPVKLLE